MLPEDKFKVDDAAAAGSGRHGDCRTSFSTSLIVHRQQSTRQPRFCEFLD